jgi:hypothetical protein
MPETSSKSAPAAQAAEADLNAALNAPAQDIPFHRFADLFPVMEGAEFEEFVADIEAHGLREVITLYQGEVLEGRNRYRACQRLKIEPRFEKFEGDDVAAAAFVTSRNIHRRHLTAAQRRDLLVKIVAAQRGKSDRAIARETGVDHKQISRARQKAESTGAVAPVEKRIGADGKARKQPAKKNARPSRAAKTATVLPFTRMSPPSVRRKTQPSPSGRKSWRRTSSGPWP